MKFNSRLEMLSWYNWLPNLSLPAIFKVIYSACSSVSSFRRTLLFKLLAMWNLICQSHLRRQPALLHNLWILYSDTGPEMRLHTFLELQRSFHDRKFLLLFQALFCCPSLASWLGLVASSPLSCNFQTFIVTHTHKHQEKVSLSLMFSTKLWSIP